MIRYFLVLIALCLSSPTLAQERVLSPERASGTSTLVTQCVSFTRVAFANETCDDLLERIDPMIRAEGLTHIGLGRTEWGFGTDEYLRADALPEPDRTLHLTIYLRGTDTPSALALWMSLYRETEGGRLELWEDSGIGAGNAGTISNGLSRGLAQKLAPVFKTIGENQ